MTNGQATVSIDLITPMDETYRIEQTVFVGDNGTYESVTGMLFDVFIKFLKSIDLAEWSASFLTEELSSDEWWYLRKQLEQYRKDNIES